MKKNRKLKQFVLILCGLAAALFFLYAVYPSAYDTDKVKKGIETVTTTVDSAKNSIDQKVDKIVTAYNEELNEQTAKFAEQTASRPQQTETAPATPKQTAQSASQPVVNGLEIPAYVKGHQVVPHNGYTLSYNEDAEQADWVAYVITVEELNVPSVGRSEDFREDPAITTKSAHLDDYRNSGYSRGHLLSSATRAYNREVNSETFLMSNMSPQIQRFNAGLYLKAEDAERDAARQYSTLYGVSGPVLTDGPYETIGSCEIWVPKEYYKVLLVQDSNGNYHAIGMILPQEYTNGALKPYLCSVDTVEQVTGLDFFPSLPDNIENAVEKTYNVNDWPIAFRQ